MNGQTDISIPDVLARAGGDAPANAPADPRWHRDLEQRVLDHVAGLFDDRRFIVPTAFGPRPTSALGRKHRRWDRSVDVKKRMVELDVPDFDLQGRLPTGAGLDVILSRTVLLAFEQQMGMVRYASLPPVDELIRGEKPQPLTAQRVRELVARLPPVTGGGGMGGAGGPMTLVLFSSGGFAEDAKRTARTFVDGPPTFLVEPNGVGGFEVTGPPGTEPLRELLDPEADEQRAARVQLSLEKRRVDLITGGVDLSAVARETKLPTATVEQEARLYAIEQIRQGVPMRVKTVEGVAMLYREGPSVTPELTLDPAAAPNPFGKASMPMLEPMMDRLRRLFGGQGQEQRKIAYLSERRAALSRQRDLLYEELGALEAKEGELREQFKADENPLARRRITSQLVQLQKDIERRRQVMGVLNQQINIVGTHLHNLEIARQGTTAQLPSSEEIAADAAKAEEVLAELQASSELADELGGQMGMLGMTAEEQRLFAELEAEARPAEPAEVPRREREGEKLITERVPLDPAPLRQPVRLPDARRAEGPREPAGQVSDAPEGPDDAQPEPSRQASRAEPEAG